VERWRVATLTSRAVAALAPLLRSYGADPPPWRGGVDAAALARWSADRPRRLDRLAGRLGPAGIDLRAGLATTDPTALTASLDRWCDQAWPALAQRDLAQPARWAGDAWGDAAPLYTLITDLGLALGERVIRCNPTRLAWGIDAYAAHEADGVASFGAIVVLDTAGAIDALDPPLYDALAEAFMRYQAIAFGQLPAPRFIEAMRPLLWESHRALFEAAVKPG
jgi:hypothetical protein